MGKETEGSDFDDDWKEEIESRVNNCKCASELCEDEVLDKLHVAHFFSGVTHSCCFFM